MIEAKDITGLGKPLTKLVEVVSAGIGTLYRPHAIRKEADAEAYRIQELEKAKTQALVTAAEGMMKIRGMNMPDGAQLSLAERARLRLQLQEIEGQANVEAISDHAANALPAAVAEEPVSDEWRRKFFREAANVCDAQLQEFWGKLLAGEVASPGAFSVRTLDVLKNLSQSEAESFVRLCAYAFSDGNVIRFWNNINEECEEFGLSYSMLMMLREAGLVHESDQLRRVPDAEPSQPYRQIFDYQGILVEITGVTQHHGLPVLVFTQAGRELQRLVPRNPSIEFLTRAAAALKIYGIECKKGVSKPIEGDGIEVIMFDEPIA